jgi:hypothetical protein
MKSTAMFKIKNYCWSWIAVEDLGDASSILFVGKQIQQPSRSSGEN